MTVGDRIKERRKSLGISADDLASILGVSRSTIFRYESGYIEKLPAGSLEPIASALHTSVKHLMGWDKDPAPASVLTGHESQLIDAFRSLNYDGQEKVLDYVSDLSDNPKYKKAELLSSAG